jgi:hypothetical protein
MSSDMLCATSVYVAPDPLPLIPICVRVIKHDNNLGMETDTYVVMRDNDLTNLLPTCTLSRVTTREWKEGRRVEGEIRLSGAHRARARSGSNANLLHRGGILPYLKPEYKLLFDGSTEGRVYSSVVDQPQ